MSKSSRIIIGGLCAVCLVGLLTRPCLAAEMSREERLAMDAEVIATLEAFVDIYASNDVYFLPSLEGKGFRIVSKDEVHATLATLALIGTIPQGAIKDILAKLKSVSDKRFEAIRRQLDIERVHQRFFSTESSPASPEPPVPAGGHWRLKAGFPKVINLNSGNTPVETVESSVSPASMTYRYAKKSWGGELEHDCTVTANYPDLGKATLTPGQEFPVKLEGTFARGKDAGLYDGKVPHLTTDGGVSIVRVEPLLPQKPPAECAKIWLGRFASGKDYDADRRTIIVSMPRDGASCEYGIAIDPSHCVTWAYEWVK